jgi:NAD(P)-dependent dehydrogenase (short-subunit alcohol dehydrogenase family)
MESVTPTEQPVVLVTGAAGGVGGATARRFTSGGWRVVALDLHPERIDVPGSHTIGADIRDVQRCRSAVAEAVRWAGRLDAVVNAAGVWTEGPSEHTTEAEFDHVLDVNLKGLYFVTSAAIPHLVTSRGCVVNISSDAGIQGNAGAAVYCASKGGVSLLTKALALELAPRGVRVNAVCPGDTDTPMLHGQARDFGGDDPDAYLQQILDRYPQGPSARFVQPGEVAELVWFLAQPGAAAITGANLSIDFGISAGTT